ncbi:MAG: DNA repair protein RadC [Halieaceae bacterium]
MGISSWSAEERPRGKMLQRGTAALSDAELLAVLLGTGARGCPVLDLSRQLLRRFNGLQGLLAASREEVSVEPGMGAAKFALLQAALELARRHAMEELRNAEVITSPATTRQFLHSHLRDPAREVFCCLFLNSQHALIACEDLFWGTLDGAAVYPREVLRRALQLQAAAVIFAHNHPSGVAEPSQADRRITERLQAALALVDIRVLDHIIIGRGAAFSFAEDGLL